MAISKRIFGSDIPLKVKQKLAIRQALNKSADFGEAIDSARSIYPPGENEENIQDSDYGTNFGGIADLSSRTPFARLWTSVKLNIASECTEADVTAATDPAHPCYGLIVGDLKYEPIDDSIKTYIIGNHVLNEDGNGNVTDSINTSDLLPTELENNKFLKPLAGITSITSATEGTLGVIKKTTVNFTVNNFTDYDKIYSRFFLKPGAQLFVDFGWDTADLYDPDHLVKEEYSEMGFEAAEPTSLDEALYGSTDDGDSVDGFVTQTAGDMETLIGFVTNYDAKIKDNGTVECSVEISSKNTALLNNDLKTSGDVLSRINEDLDISILDYALRLSKERGKHIMKSWTKSAQDLAEFQADANAYGSKYLYSRTLVPTERAVEHGVFWVGEIPKKSAPVRKQIYISYGIFEDFILNPEFGFALNKEDINKSTDTIRFDSRNSFISYDEEIFEYQQTLKDDANRHILYPDKWDNSYNIGVGRVPNRNKTDKDKSITILDTDVGRIPLREVFINTSTIKSAFSSYKDDGNILDVLKDLFEKIKTDTFDLVDLKLSNNGNSSIVSPVDINTLDIETSNEEEDNIFKKLFIFNPNSPNSIVKTFDVSFSMPSGNIGNMIAIQASSTTKIFPISEFLDEALALQSFDTVNKLEKEDGVTEIERISISYQPEIGSYKAKKLAEDTERDSSIGFNFGDTFDKLFDDPNHNQKIDKMYLSSGESEYSITIGDDPSGDTKKPDVKATPDEINKFYVRDETGDGYKVVETIKDFKKFNAVVKMNRPSNKRNSRILPLTLNLGIYGISSIIPGDVFKVDYLPQRYINTVYFQVMKVTHNLDSSGWTTNFETQFRLRKDAKIEGGLDKKIKGVTLNRKILKSKNDLFRIDTILTGINRLKLVPLSGEDEKYLDGKYSFISKKGLIDPLSFELPFYFGDIPDPNGGHKIVEDIQYPIIAVDSPTIEFIKDKFNSSRNKSFAGMGKFGDIIYWEELKALVYPAGSTSLATGKNYTILKLTIKPRLKKSDENADIVYNLIHNGGYWFPIPPNTSDIVYNFLVKLLTMRHSKIVKAEITPEDWQKEISGPSQDQFQGACQEYEYECFDGSCVAYAEDCPGG
jgi:hypothetical protein